MQWRECFAIVIMATFAGCSEGVSGPAFVPVSGVVTLDNKPVDGATIVFTPKKEGAPSMGFSDTEGKFTLKTGSGRKGAAVGDHDVTVMLSVSSEAETQTTSDGLAPATPNELGTNAPKPKPARVGFVVPERYGMPGALSVTVPPGGLSDHKLELKK